MVDISFWTAQYEQKHMKRVDLKIPLAFELAVIIIIIIICFTWDIKIKVKRKG